MTYKWDKKQILNMLKNGTTRKDAKSLLLQEADFLELGEGLHQTKRSVIKNDEILLSSMPELNTYIERFLKSDITPEESETQSIRSFSEQDAMQIAHDYYKSTNAHIYSLFCNIFSKRQTNIKFVKNNRYYTSQTTVLPSNGEIFMYVNFDGSIYGIANLIHEFAHGIGYQIKPYQIRTGAEDRFTEVESYFHTLLSLDYIENIGFENDVAIERQDILNDIIHDSNLLKSKNSLLYGYHNYAKDHSIITMSGLKNFLIEKYGFTEEEFIKCVKTPAANIINYVLGPYIAIELYKVYQTDPEYSFFLYEILRKIKADTIEDYFNQVDNLGLKPGTNILILKKVK